MKKILASVILALILFCFMNPEHVNANVIDTPAENPVIEEYVNLRALDCDIEIKNGSAIISANCRGFQSVTRIEMTVEIQEKFGLFWITKSTHTGRTNDEKTCK